MLKMSRGFPGGPSGPRREVPMISSFEKSDRSRAVRN